MRKSILKSVLITLVAFFFMSFTSKPLHIRFEVKTNTAQVAYALEKFGDLQNARLIRLSESNPDRTIRASIDSLKLKPEAYQIVSKWYFTKGPKNQEWTYSPKFLTICIELV